MEKSGLTRLFLMWACPECERIKRELTEQCIYQDDYMSQDRSRFVVLYAFSNTGARDLLDQYDLVDEFMPVLFLPDGRNLTDTEQIIEHLHKNVIAWQKRT